MMQFFALVAFEISLLPADIEISLLPADVEISLLHTDIKISLLPADIEISLLHADIRISLLPADIKTNLLPADIKAWSQRQRQRRLNRHDATSLRQQSRSHGHRWPWPCCPGGDGPAGQRGRCQHPLSLDQHDRPALCCLLWCCPCAQGPAQNNKSSRSVESCPACVLEWHRVWKCVTVWDKRSLQLSSVQSFEDLIYWRDLRSEEAEVPFHAVLCGTCTF